MAGKLKALILAVSVVMLIYFVPSANTSVAEDAEIDAREHFAGATISVEASLVAVELEVWEEIIGEPDIESLNSMPLEKIMQCVHEVEGEVVSIVRLAVANESSAEMNTEESVEEKRKISDEESGEHEERESLVSFQVKPKIIDTNRIVVDFDFKQISSESAVSSVSETEEQEGRVTKFEVSSELVLRPGQPRIVGATQKDRAILLIMAVDI